MASGSSALLRKLITNARITDLQVNRYLLRPIYSGGGNAEVIHDNKGGRGALYGSHPKN